MKEHNNIDNLFHNSLKDYLPDASHLDFSQMNELLNSKLSKQMTIDKTEVFHSHTNFGNKMFFWKLVGLVSVITTITIIFSEKPASDKCYGKNIEQNDYKKENIKPSKMNLESLPIEKQINIAKSVAKTLIHNEIKSKVSQSKNLPPRFNNNILTFANTQEKNTERKIELSDSTLCFEAIASTNFTLKYLKINQMVLESLTKFRVDSSLMLGINSDFKILSSSKSIANIPTHQIKFNFGISKVPVTQKEILNYPNYTNNPFNFFTNMKMDSIQIKQENQYSLEYQHIYKTNLIIGFGLSYCNGGWSSSSKGIIYTLADYNGDGIADVDANGNYIELQNTIQYGTTKSTFRSIGSNLHLGYCFNKNKQWMLNAFCGINNAQVIAKNTFKYQDTSQKDMVSKYSKFIISPFIGFDVVYRKSNFGFSIGGLLSQRNTIATLIKATEFYNNASFGGTVGIFYYLPENFLDLKKDSKD
ncbi:MAG: hypothetical protein HYR91_09965 [Flavobacteriia bacterium]|nr:hypothetical protein [Flavobacteriia bacterium]